MTVTIAETAIRSNAWEVIYDILYGNITNCTITSAFNDTFTNFPVLVIEPIKINMDAPTYRWSEHGYGPVQFALTVWTKKVEDVDDVLDMAQARLQSQESSLYSSKFIITDIQDSNYDTVLYKGQKYHTKSILIIGKIITNT
jgi:hypothetical protein